MPQTPVPIFSRNDLFIENSVDAFTIFGIREKFNIRFSFNKKKKLKKTENSSVHQFAITVEESKYKRATNGK